MPETVYDGKAIRKRVRATYSGPGGKDDWRCYMDFADRHGWNRAQP